VPAGSHQVVFKFEPKFYDLGYTLSNAGWVVAFGCIIVGLLKLPIVRARLGRSAEASATKETNS
jgi:hypothetical protein